jgi:hypothetical protein
MIDFFALLAFLLLPTGQPVQGTLLGAYPNLQACEAARDKAMEAAKASAAELRQQKLSPRAVCVLVPAPPAGAVAKL